MNNLADKYRDPLGDFRTLVARLGVNVWHQFREHNCMQQASALAFNTLLCLVPLSAVALFLLKTFGAFEDGNSPLIAALDNFLPRYGAEEIVSELSAFANRNLGGLGVGGFLLFLLVSTMLFMSVEQHINAIWGARRRLPVMQAFHQIVAAVESEMTAHFVEGLSSETGARVLDRLGASQRECLADVTVASLL